MVNFFVNNAVAAPRNIAVELDATVTPDPGVQTIQQETLGLVILSGIETANVEATNNAEAENLVVAGTRFDDVLTYTPRSEDDGTVTSDRANVIVNFNNFTNADDTVTLTGGSGGFADKVVVNGTNGSDLLTANVVTRTVGLDVLGFGFPPPVVAAWRTVLLDDGSAAFGTPGIVEAVGMNGMDGNDTFHVVMRDNGTPAPPVGNGLYVDIQGGSPQASDALVVTAFDAAGDPVALPDTDFVVVGQSRNPDAGNILVYQSAARRPHISYENVEVVSPNVAGGDNVLILGPDMHEQNEYYETASILGTADVINLQNLAIFPNLNEHPGVPADLDWFAVKAENTGYLGYCHLVPHVRSGYLPGRRPTRHPSRR